MWLQDDFNKVLFKTLEFKGYVNIFKTCKHFNRILQIKVYIFSNNNLLNCHVAKFKFENTQVSLSCLEWYRYKLLYMIETC